MGTCRHRLIDQSIGQGAKLPVTGEVLFYFSGILDDVRIYGGALTTDKVVAVYRGDSRIKRELKTNRAAGGLRVEIPIAKPDAYPKSGILGRMKLPNTSSR